MANPGTFQGGTAEADIVDCLIRMIQGGADRQFILAMLRLISPACEESVQMGLAFAVLRRPNATLEELRELLEALATHFNLSALDVAGLAWRSSLFVLSLVRDERISALDWLFNAGRNDRLHDWWFTTKMQLWSTACLANSPASLEWLVGKFGAEGLLETLGTGFCPENAPFLEPAVRAFVKGTLRPL